MSVPKMLTENLRPQDVLVACKIFSLGLHRGDCTYAGLGEDLGISSSTAHESVERCRSSQLLPPSGWKVSIRYLRDLLLVAVPRVFYVRRGSICEGLPTGVFASPLVGKFKCPEGALPFVWVELMTLEGGDATSQSRGEGIAPLYPTVPLAAREDSVVYELLALVDVMRLGNAADREIASSLVDRRLGIK
jgi:hypothetical protein